MFQWEFISFARPFSNFSFYAFCARNRHIFVLSFFRHVKWKLPLVLSCIPVMFTFFNYRIRVIWIIMINNQRTYKILFTHVFCSFFKSAHILNYKGTFSISPEKRDAMHLSDVLRSSPNFNSICFFLCYVHFFSADKKVHQILIYRFFPANLYINLEMKFEFLTPFIEWMKWNVSMTRTMYWTCKMFRLWGLMR